MTNTHCAVRSQIVHSTSPAAYEKSIAENRQRFARVIGVVDPRLPAEMERYGTDVNPALVAETPSYRIFQVRWPVLEGVSRVHGEGLLTPTKEPLGCVIGLTPL